MHKGEYKVLLLGWYGYNAIGDDIIADVIKQVFRTEGEKRDISLYFAPYSVIPSYPRRLYNSFCLKYDLIIIGGGSIVGTDTMSLYLSLFSCDLIKMINISRNRNTPLVIFGPGFRKESDSLPRKDQLHMKKIFERSALAGVRGPITRDLLMSHHIVDQVDIIGDPALSFKPLDVDLSLPNNSIGFNARFMKKGEIQYISNDRIANIFAQLADYFVEEDKHVFFFSFTENNHDSDSEAAKKVIQLMSNKDKPNLIPFNVDTAKTCSMIGKFDFIISQRLHPSILAWVQQIPNISFEYQFLKTTDFMKSIDMADYVIRTDEFSFDMYMDKYERLMRHYGDVKKRSADLINSYREKQRKFANSCLDIMLQDS
jgi:polysaccharide pyruvyl transferase WcaK-like protein